MKKILLLFLSCFSCTIAEAQTTPPLFQGSDDVQLFRQALMERVTEVYYSDGYTPDDLIHYFWMNFTIDTLGRCIDLEIPDTCRRQTIIVKERTLELLRTALAGIDSFIIRKTKRCDFPERSVRFCKTKCILGSTPTLLLISQNRPAYAGNVKRRLNTIQTPFALRFVASLPPMLSR